MKSVHYLFILVVTHFVAVQVASANIEQNRKAVEVRYGTGKSIAAQKPAEETKVYSFKDMNIVVEYWKGASSSEQYSNNDGSVISAAEIATILDSNVGSASWHQTSSDTWVRVDKAAIAYMGDGGKGMVVQLYAFHVLKKAL